MEGGGDTCSNISLLIWSVCVLPKEEGQKEGRKEERRAETKYRFSFFHMTVCPHAYTKDWKLLLHTKNFNEF